MSVLLRKKLNENSVLNDRIDTENIVNKLKQLYAEEIQAWYQYYIVSKFMQGQERKSIENFFDETGHDELDDHANKLLKRISELGGDISSIDNINNLRSLAHCDYITPNYPYITIKLLEDNIKSEICAIQHYIELADITKDKDYTTYNIAMDILADEEEHLRGLQDFYTDITGHEYETYHFNAYSEIEKRETF